MMQTAQRSFRVNESVVAAELDSEMVLLNIETGIYFGLDEVGTAIWTLITANADEGAIVEQIVAEYEVEPAKVAYDVRAFIERLETTGLVLSGSA
jgi:hypothetical protein